MSAAKDEFIELVWMAGHQATFHADDLNFDVPEAPVYDQYILVKHDAGEMCNPFIMADRATVEQLVPNLLRQIHRVDTDVPFLSVRTRERPYYISRDCAHPLGKELEAVRIFAVLDSGKRYVLHERLNHY